MDFNFFIPTKLIFARGCVTNHPEEFTKLGSSALIVTGRYSAKENGSLDDVLTVLHRENINYDIYDKVLPNPDTDSIAHISQKARDISADFVIGIGGGSPLDAAKAGACLATNNIHPEEIFTTCFKNKPLPIIAVPTTAGTGSEVTPYSVITSKIRKTKKGVGTPEMFPKTSFLDSRYTDGLRQDITIDTMIDAISHSVEGYFTRKKSIISDALAYLSIKNIFDCIDEVISGDISPETRDKLLYGSMLAGIVISHTGTTFLHTMGYSLTYFDGIPHGRANGLLMFEFLKLCEKYSLKKCKEILNAMGVNDLLGLKNILQTLLSKCDVGYKGFSHQKLAGYTETVINSGKLSSSLWPISNEEVLSIYINSLINTNPSV